MNCDIKLIGSWSIPGGHLEFGESFAQCASRELEEETGLQVPPEKMRYLTTINSVYEEKGKKYHFVTAAMGCEMPEGEQPVVRLTMLPLLGITQTTDDVLNRFVNRTSARSGTGPAGTICKSWLEAKMLTMSWLETCFFRCTTLSSLL